MTPHIETSSARSVSWKAIASLLTASSFMLSQLKLCCMRLGNPMQSTTSQWPPVGELVISLYLIANILFDHHVTRFI